MTVETASYINQLNNTLPADGDARSEGDDHLRLIKSALVATFPNFTATPVTANSADLSTVTGAASTGATTLKVATQTAGTNSTLAASTAYADAAVAAAAFSTSLPSQTGNSGKFVTTNGTTASWASVYTAGSDIYLSNTFGGF